MTRKSTLAAIALVCASICTAATLPTPRPHPRLQIDAALLQEIRALRAADDPAWVRLEKWGRGHSTADKPAAAVQSTYGHMLIFLAAGDRAHFDAAWKPVTARIYRNGTDRQGGISKLLDLFHGDAHQAAFQGGSLIASMAHFYDWGYSQLTPDQRKDLADWLYDAASYLYNDNKSGRAFMRNDGAVATLGLAASAYALLGDDPRADRIVGWFREYWSEVVKGLDVIGKGGAAGEGNAYGSSPTAYGFITTANVVYYATGEDLFLSHPWFRLRLAYDAFAAYPGTIGGPDAPTGYPNTPIVEEASIGGDGRRGASWHSQSLRPNGLILSRRFAGTPEAALWNWVYRQPAVDHANDDGQAVFDLLYYSPRPRLEKPTRLSYYDPNMGYVYIRSDWDSPDATWIAFWAGPHIDTHEHLDQGAFTIFKRRDLAPKTGHYDADNVKSSHHLAYYTRTVSSNGILIGDPHEVFRNFIAGMGCDAKGKGDRIPAPDSKEQLCIPNDGGQRTFTPGGMAAHDAGFFNEHRDDFDVARVVSFRDDGQAVTIAADITNAYSNPRYTAPGNSAKVTRVWRRLVYLRRADIVLVADTVESTNPAFEKKWLLHSLDRLEVGGEVWKIDDGESVHTGVNTAKIVVDDADRSDLHQTTFDLRKGYAALLVKTVFPEQFRYRVIGGRDAADRPHGDLYGFGRNTEHLHRHIKDFWVKDYNEGVLPGHKSVNWAPAFPIEAYAQEYLPNYGPGYGRWRLELEPAQPAKVDYFLNVLQPTLDAGAELPPAVRVDYGGNFGAEVKTAAGVYRILFRKDALEAPRVTRLP
jgi:hypothetical protein